MNTQVQLIYAELCKGPRTLKQLEAAGVNLGKATARMADLRRWLQPQGMDWLNDHGTYHLVVPQ